MGTTPLDNEEQFASQYEFLSNASLWLAWFEMTTLWPLTREERKEFRKKFLLKVSAVIDTTLRSGPFLEILQQFFASPAEDRAEHRPAGGSGASGGTNPQMQEAMEEALRELQRMMHEKSEPESANPGPARGAAYPSATKAQTARERERAGRDATGGPRPAPSGEVSERLVSELQETNAQLRQLLALQREVLDLTAAEKHRSYGVTRNGT